MKNEYLLEEIIESINELYQTTDNLEETFRNNQRREFLYALEEVDMISEHIISCVGAIKGKSRE